MPTAEQWQRRLRAVRAIPNLCMARVLVELVPFDRWRTSLSLRDSALAPPASVASALALAEDVERAAQRLPFATKCLPRAMALSWLLRDKRIAHTVVFAVRPPRMRTCSDALHAWVEVAGVKVLGDLAGPWIETLRLGDPTFIES